MIPSLLQIPSAVSDSKLHSVLPNNGKGDFTFDRSTGATRINKDGLIEEVGYFSSELVQNGNFSELGSELAPADDFAADFVANPSSGTVVNSPNGTLTFTNSTSTGANVQLKNRSVTTTKTYKIQFTISNYVSGTFKMSVGNQISNAASANGTYTFYIEYTSGLNRNYFYTTNSTLTVSNISVKQVDPNDRWSLGSNWAYGSNKVIGSATTSEIQQDVDLPSGKVYKTTFTIEDYVSGSVRIRFRGGTTVSGTNRSGNGTYTEILTSTGHTNVKIDGFTSFTGSVTNISVVEVQGDRPRLSYDITNGVVESQPHLLLEPSRTNLYKYSENVSAWSLVSNVTRTASYTQSPEGLNNATRLQFTSNGYTANETITSGTQYNVSVYAKRNDTGTQSFGFFVDGSGTVDSEMSLTSEWKRFNFTHTATNGSFVGLVGLSGADVSVYGMQLEVGSYATSLIPTAGTTITRAAETCNNSKPSVNSTEGVLYAEYKPTFAAGSRQITISDGTYDERIVFECRESGTKLRANIAAGGVGQTEITIPISSLDKYYKIAIQYKANDVSFYIDGELKGTDTSATMPTGMNVVSFSGRNDASLIMTGKTKGVAVYNEALSESQLMQLTGVTASSIYSNFVTRTASFTVEALNEVKKVIDNL